MQYHTAATEGIHAVGVDGYSIFERSHHKDSGSRYHQKHMPHTDTILLIAVRRYESSAEGKTKFWIAVLNISAVPVCDIGVRALCRDAPWKNASRTPVSG